MNKKIKKIIAVALTVSAFYAISPTTNFMTTKAYASTTSDTQLSSLYLSDGSIDFSASKTSYTINVSSSVDDIRITARPHNHDSSVEIDGTTVDSGDSYRDTVSLDKGKNTIKVKVTDDHNNTRTYTLTINRGTSSSSNDDVYLDRIDLSDGSINFSKSDTSYDVKVDSSVDEIKITAEPDDSDDKVRIDGSTVDDDDDYKKTVSLNKGSNKIEIEVEDDDDSDRSRTYTLNITRGTSTDDQYLDELSINGADISLVNTKTSYDVSVKESIDEIKIKAEPQDNDYDSVINGSTVDYRDDFEKTVSLNRGKNAITIKVKDDNGRELRTYTLNVTRGAESIKANQWVEVNGQLQYNDASGNPMKNNWFIDRSTSKSYYLNANGNKSTGWQTINSSWYLFDSAGVMLNGWQLTGGSWYLLDQSGIMLKGWQFTGGAWYYLNDNGTMATGWIIDQGKYYYLNSNGSMAHDTTVGGYKLASSGAWIR